MLLYWFSVKCPLNQSIMIEDMETHPTFVVA
jgi:hypothetical protein